MVVLLCVAVGILSIEIALFLGWPRVLARIAFLPLGLSREVPISDRLRSELSLRQAHETGYREAPRTVLSLARLQQAIGERRIELVDTSLRLEPDGRLYLRAMSTRRRPTGLRSPQRRPWLIASISARLANDALVLRARAIPVPCFGLAAFVGAVVVEPPIEARALVVALVTSAVFLGMNVAFNRSLVRRAMDCVEDELRRDGP